MKKDQSNYLEWKRSYWRDLLNKIQTNIAISGGTSILDIGCGPAGIFIILEDNKVEAIDPLVESYEKELDHFSRDNYPYVRFHNIQFENYNELREFKVTFLMNAINHFIDLKASIIKAIDLTSEGGHVVITIDAHNFTFFKYLFRLIPGDILHPHQFGLREYQDFFENGTTLVEQHLIKKAGLFNHYLLVFEKRTIDVR